MSTFNYWASLFSIFLIFIFLFKMYEDYRVDKFRQDMFKIRDDLFDYAMRGRLSFNDPSYGLIRGAINGHIRFAHRINLLDLAMFNRILEQENYVIREPFSERLQKSMEHLTSEQKDFVTDTVMKMNFKIIEHLSLSSPIILAVITPFVFIPWVCFVQAKNHAAKLVGYLKKPLDKIENISLVSNELSLC